MVPGRVYDWWIFGPLDPTKEGVSTPASTRISTMTAYRYLVALNAKSLHNLLSPGAQAIEPELKAGKSFRDIAEQFRIAKSAIARHRSLHINGFSANASEVESKRETVQNDGVSKLNIDAVRKLAGEKEALNKARYSTTIYLDRDFHSKVKIAFIEEGQDRDFNRLVNELLREWMNIRG